VTQRERVRGAVGLAVLVLVWSLSLASRLAAEELRIGFLAPLTGQFAQIGEDMTNGFKMYLDEVNNEFAGAKVTFIVEDEQGKPPVGISKAEKLILQDQVHMFVGGLLASTGYALAPVSSRHKVIYIASPFMGDEAIGYVTPLQYSAALETPKNVAFVKKYRERFGKVPSYYSESNYTTAQWIHETMKKTDGKWPGTEEFIKVFASVTLETIRGPVRLDEQLNPRAKHLHPQGREEKAVWLSQR
jgi:ABC-type branched-subunit amino acid transport system substrate-binding protein